jgi:hypothetical protein
MVAPTRKEKVWPRAQRGLPKYANHTGADSRKKMERHQMVMRVVAMIWNNLGRASRARYCS